MVSFNTFRIETPDDREMGEPPQAFPRYVFVWRVSFDEENDEFRLYYKKCVKVDLQSNDFSVFETFLKGVVDDTKPDNWRDPVENDVNQPGETPLSIWFDDYAYMVFILKGKKWRFSRKSEPFRIQNGFHHKYLMARCAWRDAEGAFHYTKKPGQQPTDPNCTVAFFIADVREQGNGVRASFNVYVDLEMSRRSRSKRYVPVVVDPDVGYPEGLKPEP